jgi:hypothetical protein
MRKVLSAAVLLAAAGAALAQSTPSTPPSQAPTVTPPPTPYVAPSQTPYMGERVVGGLSRCENLLGDEKEKCRKDERAGTGSTSPQTSTPSTPPAR